MRKRFILSAIAALAVSPFGVQEKAYGMENESQYSNLTETQSFYRVTRGFISPLSELDNAVETKVQFTKGKYLTYMDYIFLNEVSVKEIQFSSDTPQYERILLLRNSVIQHQFDFYKYPDGVITLPSELVVDQIKLQFNGVEGTQHSLAELEIVGRGLTTGGANAPSGDATFVTPDIIAELIDENAADEENGGGTPGTGVTPDIPEEGDGSDGTGTGETAEGGTIPEEGDGSENGTGGGEPVVTEPPTEIGDGNVGEGSDGGTPLEEGNDEGNDGIGDTDYIDNGEEEEATPQPDGGGAIPENPEAPDEEEASDEAPVFPGEDTLVAKAKPLTPSVFKNKHTYKVYGVNSASMKLMEHKHFDEAFLKMKLADSYVLLGEEYLTIGEFIAVLKEQHMDEGKKKFPIEKR